MTSLRPVDVILDSNYASNNNPDAPSWDFEPILSDVVGMNVMWANIPYSYYVIDRLCNEFEFEVNDVAYTIKLEPGTYDPDSIENGFKSAIYQAGAVYAASKMTMFFESHTGRLVMLQAEASAPLPFRVRFPAELAFILGFEADVWLETDALHEWYRDGLVLGDFYGLRAAGLANLTYAPMLTVHANLGIDVSDSCRTHNDFSDALIRLPVNNTWTGFISYSHNGTMIPLARRSIDRVEMSVRLGTRATYAAASSSPDTDDWSAVPYVPFNGQGFQVCLRFFVDDGRIQM